MDMDGLQLPRRQSNLVFSLAVLAALLLAPRAGLARVILISLDGLRPDAIDLADTPHLESLIATGSYSAFAQCELPPATLPNHTTMITGVSVETHGVWFNTLVEGKVGVRTLHDEIAAAEMRTGFFASKSKLGYIAHEESIDTFEMRGTIVELTDLIVEQIVTDPLDFIFFHSRQPDSTGHQFGWLSDEYLAAVELADEQVGRILAAIDAAGLDDVNVLVTGDHGGEGMTHIFNVPAVRLIPWIANGPDIAADRTLCSEIHQRDMAATVLALFDLPIPENYEGEPIVEAFKDTPQTQCDPVAPILGPPCLFLLIPAAGFMGLWFLWGRLRRTPGVPEVSAESEP